MTQGELFFFDIFVPGCVPTSMSQVWVLFFSAGRTIGRPSSRPWAGVDRTFAGQPWPQSRRFANAMAGWPAGHRSGFSIQFGPPARMVCGS